MPLARIITDVADDCLELTMQLRARGFQVETVPPGLIPSTPADLEVRLEECAPEDVLNQAAQSSPADDLWVYIAPGALDENAKPVRTIPLAVHPIATRLAPSVNVSTAPKQGAGEHPVVFGSLAIDADEEDLILAELREFRLPNPSPNPVSQTSGVPDHSPAIEKARIPSRLPNAEVEPSKAIKVPERIAVRGSGGVRGTEGKLARLRVAPSLPVRALKQTSATDLPIAPVPVPKVVFLSSAATRRRAQVRHWNLHPLKVACGVVALTISGWLLVGSLRPETTPSSALPRTILQAGTPRASGPEPRPAAPTQIANTRVKSGAYTAVHSHTPPSPPQVEHVAKVTSKPRAHRAAEDLIARDTVIFYDHKHDSQRPKVQPEPGVKRYSDQN
jgi:hypothetical protein